MHKITQQKIVKFQTHLKNAEKADATVRKYVREIQLLSDFLAGEPVTKEKILQYRESLRQHCQAGTVNGKLSAVNAYLKFAELEDCSVKFLKIQRRAFIEEERQLQETDYQDLLCAAKELNKERLYYMLLTICSTGIRVSELQYITVEAVEQRKTEITMKGKNRIILLPRELACRLSIYIKKNGIQTGSVFQTKRGKPVDRSNICHEMKRLSEQAGIQKTKVFPYNLRHLFARKYYEVEKDIAHLADVLGHSSIETTRLYVSASVSEHEKILGKIQLIS